MPGILLVEDSKVFREAISDMLRERFPSLMIEEASSQRTALEKVMAFSPEFILMDIRLPDGDGLSLTKRILELNPNTKILIITSYDIPEYRNAAKTNGAIGFLVKGDVTFDDLMRELESIIPSSEVKGTEREGR